MHYLSAAYNILSAGILFNFIFIIQVMHESLIHHIEMLGWVKLQLKKLSKTCKIQSHHCNNVIDSINEIKSMYFLKKDFQINVTLEEYQDKKKQILQNYVRRLCDSMK